ncbi:hypothetical protein F2Q69_00013896 [Brassica cretica]|uniref:Uncharacterized protein n=1 Tax=Brassica cretica TaxID=69181 RepID=A0A8S9QKB0_BRACR|nr:hypothetical protein F2Q69_00013896 [Brassica cretica]
MGKQIRTSSIPSKPDSKVVQNAFQWLNQYSKVALEDEIGAKAITLYVEYKQGNNEAIEGGNNDDATVETDHWGDGCHYGDGHCYGG